MRDLHPDRVVLSVAFYVFSTGMILGLLTPLSMAGMAAVMGVMVIGYGDLWGVEDWGHHHTTLHMLAVFWLALTPCGGSFSVDRWWRMRRAEQAGLPMPLERGPLWGTVLIRILLTTIYLWSLVDKIDAHFLTGVQLEQLGMEYYFGAVPPEGPLWTLLWQGLSWTRLPLMVLGIVMHLGFYVLIPVQTFSLQMLLLYLAFLDPERVHAFIDRHLGHPEAT